MSLRLECNLCSTPFELSDEQLSQGVTVHSCEKCGGICHICKLPAGNERIKAIEMHGCQLLDLAAAEMKRPERTDVDEEARTAEEEALPVQATQQPIPVAEVTVADNSFMKHRRQDAAEKTVVDLGPSQVTEEHAVVEEQGASDDATEPVQMLDWIQEEAESKEEAALEGVLFEWKIIRGTEQSFSFHFLIALRKWIMDGRVTAGDTLMTSAGARYLVEEYPGTADLFSKMDIMKQRRSRVLAKKRRSAQSKISVRHFLKRRGELIAMAASLFIALTFAGRYGWNHWEFKRSAGRASSYLSGLNKLNLSTPALTDFSSVDALIWTDDENSIRDAVTLLTGHLSTKQTDSKAICLLAEALIRRAVMTGSVTELALARNLLDHVKEFHETAVHLQRAEAAYAWSSGDYKRAAKAVDEYMARSDDPFGYYLKALLAIDVLDWQQAKKNLHQAIKVSNGNAIFISGLAKVLEREEKWPQAIAVLEDALEKEPMNPTLIRRLALCNERMGNITEAEQLYMAGMQVSDRPEEFQFLLISLYNSQSHHEQTIKAASHYVEVYPEGSHLRLVQRYSEQAQNALISQEEEDAEMEKRRMGYTGASRRRIWIRR